MSSCQARAFTPHNALKETEGGYELDGHGTGLGRLSHLPCGSPRGGKRDGNVILFSARGRRCVAHVPARAIPGLRLRSTGPHYARDPQLHYFRQPQGRLPLPAFHKARTGAGGPAGPAAGRIVQLFP